MAKARSDPLAVQSVEKAFRVLETFDARHATLSLTELSAATGLDKSAVQRFTHTLVKLGYIQKNASTKRFSLTPKALEPGYNYIRASNLVSVAMPYMLHLSNETEETISLTQLDGTEIVYIARVMSRHVLSIDITVGTRLPAWCASSGVAILSRLAPEILYGVIGRSELRPFTQNTVWRREDVLARIAEAGSRGYATSFGDIFHGDLSLGAPILNDRAEPIGGINISVSESRYRPADMESRFAHLIVAAAQSISQGASTTTVPA